MTPRPVRWGPSDATSGPAAERAPGDDLFTNLVLGAVGLLVAAGAIIHAGAVLAAWLSGWRGPLGATLADSARAVLALPSHLGHPAQAWPAGARPALPGPWLFWACVIAVVAAAAAVAFAGWRALQVLGGSAGQALGVRSEAGFARVRDLRALTVSKPCPGRLTIGRVGRRLVAAEPQASLAVIGPTGCGKTAGLAIPA